MSSVRREYYDSRATKKMRFSRRIKSKGKIPWLHSALMSKRYPMGLQQKTLRWASRETIVFALVWQPKGARNENMSSRPVVNSKKHKTKHNSKQAAFAKTHLGARKKTTRTKRKDHHPISKFPRHTSTLTLFGGSPKNAIPLAYSQKALKERIQWTFQAPISRWQWYISYCKCFRRRRRSRGHKLFRGPTLHPWYAAHGAMPPPETTSAHTLPRQEIHCLFLCVCVS